MQIEVPARRLDRLHGLPQVDAVVRTMGQAPDATWQSSPAANEAAALAAARAGRVRDAAAALAEGFPVSPRLPPGRRSAVVTPAGAARSTEFNPWKQGASPPTTPDAATALAAASAAPAAVDVWEVGDAAAEAAPAAAAAAAPAAAVSPTAGSVAAPASPAADGLGREAVPPPMREADDGDLARELARLRVSALALPRALGSETCISVSSRNDNAEVYPTKLSVIKAISRLGCRVTHLNTVTCATMLQIALAAP